MQERNLFPRTKLWAAMVGPPVIWTVHFYGVWMMIEWGCLVGAGTATWFGLNALHVAALALSFVALGLFVFIAFMSYQMLRRANAIDADTPSGAAREIERTRFMAWAGLGFSALFGTISLFVTVPIFVMPVC